MNELKYIILSLFLASCSIARAQDNNRPLFIHGLEWGGNFNYFNYRYCLFVNSDQYLEEDRTKERASHFNGFLNYNAGVALRKMEVLAYAGYQGFYKHIRMVQTGLKTDIHRRPDRNGLFGFAEGCIGIPLFGSEDRSAVYCAGGIGYRTRLSRHVCLDHRIGISNAIVSPREITDPTTGNLVDPENIRQSKANAIGLRFSTGFRF